jgi:aspartate racemase
MLGTVAHLRVQGRSAAARILIFRLNSGTRGQDFTRGALRFSQRKRAAHRTEKGRKMKTIGILGGIGPQATMDFELLLHRAAQRLIPQHGNGGYPPTVVWYCRHPPVLLDADGKPQRPRRPDPRLLEAADKLGALVDFIVLPCNGVHLLRADIEAASGRRVLNMIDLTLAEVNRRGWKKIGVLGLHEPVVYIQPLSELDLACETIDGDCRAALDRAIFGVMEGRASADMTNAARGAVQTLRARGVDGIILGCTEIPCLLREAGEMPDLLNPLPLLADAAVRFALC